jgi:obg-like ATPase 1
VNPVRDLEIIHRELQLKDIQNLRGYIMKNARNVARNLGGKDAKAELLVAVKALNWLLHGDVTGSADEWAADLGDISKKSSSGSGEELAEEDNARESLGLDIRAASWSGDEIESINKFQLLTAKPMTYLINLSLKQYTTQKCKWLEPVSEFIKARGCGEKFIPFSAAFEAKFEEMGDTPERAKWLEEAGNPKTMIPRMIRAGYKTLSLVHFFTCGPDEVRAWTVRSGSFAPRAAGVIHTDFEKGFICAEVQKFDDLKEGKCRFWPTAATPLKACVCSRIRAGRQGRREAPNRGQGIRSARWRHHVLQGESSGRCPPRTDPGGAIESSRSSTSVAARASELCGRCRPNEMGKQP